MAARCGFADGQYQYGDCLYSGIGVPKNIEQALIWYQRAIDQGHVGAIGSMAVCFQTGNGMEGEKDIEEALKWFQSAADTNAGLATAECNLGILYDVGAEGIQPDPEKAVKYYRKAAIKGDLTAKCNLAVCYHNGIGVPEDKEEAVKWWRQSAEGGYAPGQYNLGVCYQNGLGVRPNKEEAFKWYKLAAEQGDQSAMQNLAWAYKMGFGTPRNEELAIHWLAKQQQIESGGQPSGLTDEDEEPEQVQSKACVLL